MHSIKYSGYRIGIQVNNSVLAVEQNNCTTKIVSAYLVYDLNTWPIIPLSNFRLKKYFYDATKIVKNSDKGNWVYCGYGVAFDRKGSWNFGNDLTSNIIIFGVSNSSSSHRDNLKNNILELSKK